MRDMTNQDRLSATVNLRDWEIEVLEPTSEQVYVLAQVRRMVGGDAKTAFRALGMFGGVLDNLFAHEDDQDRAYNMLSAGTLSLDDFMALITDITTAFNIELPEEEGDAGPRRPGGRARAVTSTKRPAARRK